MLLKIAGVALGVWITIGLGLGAMRDGYTYDTSMGDQRPIYRSERPVKFWFVSVFYTLAGFVTIFYSLGYFD